MQIDTYYVGVVPRFDTVKFNKIKQQIQSLSKLSTTIPVKLSVTNNSISGIKSQIRNKINSQKILANIPLRFHLLGKHLTDIQTSLKGVVLPPIDYPVRLSLTGKTLSSIQFDLKGIKLPPYDYPVRLSLTGKSITELSSQIKAIKFKPIDIPANITFGGADSIIRASQLIVGKINAPAVATTERDVRGGGHSFLGTGKDIVAYGVSGSLIYGAGSMVASPFLAEDYLVNLKATEGFENSDLKKMREVIDTIAGDLPLTTKEIAKAAMEMAKSGTMTYEDIFGKNGDLTKGLLYSTSRIAAYESVMGARPNEVFDLTKQVTTMYPELKGNSIATEDYIKAMFDVTKWDTKQLSIFLGRLGVGTGQVGKLDKETLLVNMGLASMTNVDPSDPATSLKTLVRFSQIAKSNNAAVALDTLGLERYSDDKTNVENFKVFQNKTLELYKKLDANGGKLTLDEYIWDNKLKKSVATGKKVTIDRKEFDTMVDDIAGQDAMRQMQILAIKGVDQVIEQFKKTISNANFQKGFDIIQTSTMYQLKRIFSNIEVMFSRAFDQDALDGIELFFKEVANGVADFSRLIKNAEGLSGIFENLKKTNPELSELIYGIKKVSLALVNLATMLNSIFNFFKSLPETFDISIPLNPFNLSTHVDKLKEELLQTGSWIKKTYNKYLGTGFKAKTNTPYVPMEMHTGKVGTVTNTNSGNVTINMVAPNDSNPNVYARATANKVKEVQASHSYDEIVNSGLGSVNGY